MLTYLPLVFTLLLILASSSASKHIFITPHQSCGLSCAGDSTSPYDNLLIALAQTAAQDELTIYILNDPLASHFILSKEYDNTNTSFLYELKEDQIINLKKRTIKPLFCDDLLIDSTPNLKDYCLDSQEKITIYVKTTRFSLNILEALEIQSIIFHASEDIQDWNSPSSDLSDCLYNRKRCCTDPSEPSSSSIKCKYSGDYSSLSLAPKFSLFNLTNSQESATLIFDKVNFYAFISPRILSLVAVGSPPFNLIIKSCIFDTLYFDKGLIYQSGDLDSSCSISILDTSFTNYNPYDLLLRSSIRSEGYFLYSEGYYAGTFTISNSIFENTTSSLRDQCFPLNETYYKRPMNNQLMASTYSKTDLWSQFYYDHQNTYGSSLFFFNKFDGELKITDSDFQNILGTSGSVLRIDDIPQSKTTQIKISNTNFDQNFAYDGFANIRISKKSDPGFSKMSLCPRITIQSSNFTNAYGCPGSYGNNIFVCYWDTKTASLDTLSDYSITDELISSWEQTDQSDSYINIQDSLFENNILGLSTSLAIIGSPFTYLQNNNFHNNGGSTAEIIFTRLANSYFANRYPSRILTPEKLNHFGQATTVYIDRLIRFTSIGNQFWKNWGPWEGSRALGESLTIKNWIRLAGTMNFDFNEFAYHKGIPASFTFQIADSGLKNNVLTPPTITISYDDEGTTAIYNKLPETSAFLKDIKITMNHAIFQNNTASYFGNKYTYNLANVKNLVQGSNAAQKRFSSGFIKFLTTVESNDVPQSTSQTNPFKSNVGFVLYNATIANNKLLSMGCLFPTQWIDSYFLLESHVHDNEIFLEKETFTLVGNRDDPDLLTIGNSKQGLFCANIDDTQSLWGTPSLLVNNAIINNNKGILFNFATENMNLGMFTNTLFINNTCWNASMITVFNTDLLFTNNVTFINNFNTLGNIFIYKQAQYAGLFHTYLNNSGLHASLILVTQSENYFQTEHFVRAYWNDVNPTSIKLFANGLAPQGGLNFIASSYYLLAFADYRQNKAYSGIFNTVSATLLVDYVNISDHNIAGTSVVGNFLSLTNVLLRNVDMNNNSLTSDPKIDVSRLAMILLYTSRFEGTNVNFINGSVDGGAVLLFGNTVNTFLLNTQIKNFRKLDSEQISLFWCSFATMNFTDASFENVSSVFSIGNSKLYAQNVNFSDIKMDFDTQFIVQSFQSNITLRKVKYTGNGEVGTLTSLIEGDKNTFEMSQSEFIDATGGNNKIIDLKSSTSVYLGHNKFIYTQGESDVQVMSFSSSKKIIIDSCVFSLAGKTLETLMNQDDVILFNNVIITTSKHQNILAQNVKNISLLRNSILSHGSFVPGDELPIAPVQIIDASGNISISQNNLISLIGVTGGLTIQSQQSPYNANITDNTFIQCQGSFGGAIDLSVQKKIVDKLGQQVYSRAEITGGIFLLNNAKYDKESGQSTGKGGAIFQTSLNKVHQETLIYRSIFVNNSAEILGGAIYFDYSPLEIDSQSSFINNYASQRLNHIGSYPTQLVLYDLTNPLNTTYIPTSSRRLASSSAASYYQWENVPSGLTTDTTYIFALLDMYDQLCYDDSSSQLTLQASGFSGEQKYAFSSKLSSIAQQGLYYYKDFVFNYQVDKKINISFTSNAIQSPDPLTLNTPYSSSSIQVEVQFRDCQFGEFLVVDGQFTKCQTCQAGFWSVSVNNMVAGGSCTECDSTSTICLGGSKIGPKYGYWRKNETADIVMACPDEKSCLGNNLDTEDPNPTGQCKEGAEGNLCNSCIEGWARSSPTSDCINCQTSWMQYMQLFLYIAVQIAFLVYGVRETMQMTQKSLGAEANTAILLRIMINYVQIVSLVGEIPVTWPQALKNFIAVNSRLSSASNQFFSIDCFFIIGKAYTQTRIVFLKTLLAATLPFIYIAVATLFWIIYFKLKKRPILNNKNFTSNVITTIVIICFNLQPDILKNSFQLFQCANLYRTDAPELFMNLDYDVQCWTPEHFTWVLGLGVPCLALWGLILPGYAFVILKRNIKNIETEEMRKKYSFIYMGYKTKKFYWEFIVMLRKMALICVTVFAGFQSVNLEIYLSLLIIVFSYCLQKINKPYKDKTLNNLEKICLVSAGVVNFCGLYFQIVKDVDGLDTLILLSGLLGNLYFLFYFCKYFLICQIERLKQNPRAMKIINYILNKFCCCLKSLVAQKAIKRARTFLTSSKTKLDGGSAKSLYSFEESPNKSQRQNPNMNSPDQEPPSQSQIELAMSPNMSIDWPGTLNDISSVRNMGGSASSSRHHLLKNPSRFSSHVRNKGYTNNLEVSLDGNITDRKIFKRPVIKVETDYEQETVRRSDKEDDMNDLFDEICIIPAESKDLDREAESLGGFVSQIMMPSAISVQKLKSTNLDSAGGCASSLELGIKKGEL